MDLFGKGLKVEGKRGWESIGIRFQPIIFYPDRNEYELCIEVPGCPKDLIKVSYDEASGKLILQGNQKSEFAHQFAVPADCLAAKIHGRLRGNVLHIIMPRLFSEWPASKQGDDQKASSDWKATEMVGEDREKLLGRVQSPPLSDQKSTDRVKGGGNDREKLLGRVQPPPPSDQKSTDKLPARVPAPPSTDQETTEKSVVESQKKGRTSGKVVAKNAKIVTESKAKEESEEKKTSVVGNETLGLVGKVKETGKAMVAAAMKEENRLVVMIGAAVLAIVVIGASLRSNKKIKK